MLKKCMMCYREFNALGPAIMCSERCSKDRRNEKARKCRAKNPDKWRKYHRKYHAKHIEKHREQSREHSRKLRAIFAAVKKLGLIQPGDFK